MPKCKNNNKNPTTQPKRVAEGSRGRNKTSTRKYHAAGKGGRREYKTRAANEADIADHGKPTTDEPGFRSFPQKGSKNPPRKDHMTHRRSGNMTRNRASTVNSDGHTTQHAAYLENLAAKRSRASSSGFMEPERCRPRPLPTYKTKPPPNRTSKTNT